MTKCNFNSHALFNVGATILIIKIKLIFIKRVVSKKSRRAHITKNSIIMDQIEFDINPLKDGLDGLEILRFKIDKVGN